MPATIQLRDGDTLLLIVQDGNVMHTWDIALSHEEFVRRTVGELPAGAWVGSIRKGTGGLDIFNSRTFYGNQLPAPQAVIDVVKGVFR